MKPDHLEHLSEIKHTARTLCVQKPQAKNLGKGNLVSVQPISTSLKALHDMKCVKLLRAWEITHSTGFPKEGSARTDRNNRV